MRKKGIKLLILTEEKSGHTFIQIADNLNIILLKDRFFTELNM